MRIKELRKLKGVKQGVLAKDMGVSQPTVSDWESGKINPTIENLISLSQYFSVTVGCIIGTEPIPEGYPTSNIKPIQRSETIEPREPIQSIEPIEPLRVAEPQKPFRRKAPFSQEQMDYLEEWGDRLAERIAGTLREDSSSSGEKAK